MKVEIIPGLTNILMKKRSWANSVTTKNSAGRIKGDKKERNCSEWRSLKWYYLLRGMIGWVKQQYSLSQMGSGTSALIQSFNKALKNVSPSYQCLMNSFQIRAIQRSLQNLISKKEFDMFGLSHCTRLSFGVMTSSEMFQRKLTVAIVDLVGIMCVTYDIVVHTENHDIDDQRLKKLLQRCRDMGIKLEWSHSWKQMKWSTWDTRSQGRESSLIPRRSKQSPICLPQQTKQKLEHFKALWPIQPSSFHTSMLKDDSEFIWGSAQQNAFDEVKNLITNAPVLAYDDFWKELIVQCDTSNKGLSGCLIQDNKPLAHQSRALTSTEQN